MGSTQSTCCTCGKGDKIPVATEAKLASENVDLVCTEWSHVESLLSHLPPEVHATLEDKNFQIRCHQAFRDIAGCGMQNENTEEVFLEGDQLIEAVHRSVPDNFLKSRMHNADLKKMVLAFDTNSDGRISQNDFDLFCMWAVAMDVMGFFTGTSPFAKIANETDAKNLLIISEFLDPEHILGKCVLPNTVFAYYHPDGIALDEFSAQLESAVHVRTKKGLYFESVALANHGPDEDGIWSVCSDHPVSLHSLDSAWPRLMPLFQALADMVTGPAGPGHVDLLACNFAANQVGLQCLDMIERQVNARFSASSDATGNVANNGNWELERGGRNVAKIYFHEDMLGQFTALMAAKPARMKAHDNIKNPNDYVPAHANDLLQMTEAQKVMQNQESLMAMGAKHWKAPDPSLVKEVGRRDDLDVNQHMLDAVACAGGDAPSKRHKAKAQAKRKPPQRHDDAKKQDMMAFMKGE